MDNIAGNRFCGYWKKEKSSELSHLVVTGICLGNKIIPISEFRDFSEDDFVTLKNIKIKNYNTLDTNPSFSKSKLIEFLLAIPDKRKENEFLVKQVNDLSKLASKYKSLCRPSIKVDKKVNKIDEIELAWNESSMKKIFDKFYIRLGTGLQEANILDESIMNKYLAYLNAEYNKKEVRSVAFYPDKTLNNDISLSSPWDCYKYRADDYFYAINYVFAAIRCILLSDVVNPFKQGDKVLYYNDQFDSTTVCKYINEENGKLHFSGGVQANPQISLCYFSLYDGDIAVGTEINRNNSLHKGVKNAVKFVKEVMGIPLNKIPVICNCSNFFVIEHKKEFDLLNDINFVCKESKEEYKFSDIFTAGFINSNNNMEVLDGTTTSAHCDLVFSHNYESIYQEILDYKKKNTKIDSLVLNYYNRNVVDQFDGTALHPLNKIFIMSNFSDISNCQELQKTAKSTFLPLDKLIDIRKETMTSSNNLFNLSLEDIKLKEFETCLLSTGITLTENRDFYRNTNKIKFDDTLVNGELFSQKAFTINKMLSTSNSVTNETILSELNELKKVVLPEREEIYSCRNNVIEYLTRFSKVTADNKNEKLAEILNEINALGRETFTGRSLKRSVLIVVKKHSAKYKEAFENYRKENNIVFENLRISYNTPALSKKNMRVEEECNTKEDFPYFDYIINIFDKNSDYQIFESNKTIKTIVLCCDFEEKLVTKKKNDYIVTLNEWIKKSPYELKIRAIEEIEPEVGEIAAQPPEDDGPDASTVAGEIAGGNEEDLIKVEQFAILNDNTYIFFSKHCKVSVVSQDENGAYDVKEVTPDKILDEDEIILGTDGAYNAVDTLINYFYDKEKSLLTQDEQDAITLVRAWKNQLREEWSRCVINRYWDRVGVCQQTMESWVFGTIVQPREDDVIQKLGRLLNNPIMENDIPTFRKAGDTFYKLRQKIKDKSAEAIVAKKMNQISSDPLVQRITGNNITQSYYVEKIQNCSLQLPYDKVNKPIKGN